MNYDRKITYIDDDTESVNLLFRLRAPALIMGLLLGIIISFLTSNFEEVLAHDIRVAFFLPFIVYLADAIGTQTQTIYARDMRTGKAKFQNYLMKEAALGIVFGILFSVIAAIVIFLWFEDMRLVLSVGISIFIASASAPIVALLITQASTIFHSDPAAESGPIATVVQDMLSVVIYGIVSSLIIL